MRDLILVLAFIAPIALAPLALAVVRYRRRARARRAVRERTALTLAGCCCHRAGSPHACRNPNPAPKGQPPSIDGFGTASKCPACRRFCCVCSSDNVTRTDILP